MMLEPNKTATETIDRSIEYKHIAWETVEITSEPGRQTMIQDHTWR